MQTASEEQESIIQKLLGTSTEFKRLYIKHDELKKTIHEMQKERFPDQQNLEEMKKKKLVLKDHISRFLKDAESMEA